MDIKNKYLGIQLDHAIRRQPEEVSRDLGARVEF